jgi:hypothetical protein
MHHYGKTVGEPPNGSGQPTMIFPWAVFNSVEKIKFRGDGDNAHVELVQFIQIHLQRAVFDMYLDCVFLRLRKSVIRKNKETVG